MNRRHFLVAAGLTAATALTGFPAGAQETRYDRFSVVVRGSGPDVILVPGLACSRDVWNGVVAGLGDRYRVHLVQVAGFAGEPPRGNADGEVCAGVAEGLAGYIAAQCLTRPAIIGHSMGGTIALMVAARYPDAIGRIMVVDMLPDLAAVTVGPNASPQQVRVAADMIGEAMEHAGSALYEMSLAARIDGMILTPAARPDIIRQGMASDRAVAGRAMRELIGSDLRPELSRIVAPATIVYAWNNTNPRTAAQVDRLMRASYARLKGVRLVRIDDSAHFIFLDQPARFEAVVIAFLQS